MQMLVNGEVEISMAEDFSAWKRMVSSSFVPLDVTSSKPRTFSGSMRSRTIEGISIVQISADQHDVSRTYALIEASDEKYFKLSLMLEGRCKLFQDDRETMLEEGDIAVYDTQRPYTLSFDQSFRSLVLMFPHHMIDLPASVIGRLTAIKMSQNSGLGKLISPFLTEIARNLEQLNGTSGMRLAHNAVDLVTTMLSAELDMAEQTTQSPKSQLQAQIYSYIDANLGNLDLGPAVIAADHFISTRYLHMLFREGGETVTAWIRNRRMGHIRRDLRDPVLAHHSIGTIAAKWGFPDAAHFSRVFRTTFGLTPSSYRAS